MAWLSPVLAWGLKAFHGLFSFLLIEFHSISAQPLRTMPCLCLYQFSLSPFPPDTFGCFPATQCLDPRANSASLGSTMAFTLFCCSTCLQSWSVGFSFITLDCNLPLFIGVLICFICKLCEGSGYFHCILNGDHLFSVQ